MRQTVFGDTAQSLLERHGFIIRLDCKVHDKFPVVTTTTDEETDDSLVDPGTTLVLIERMTEEDACAFVAEMDSPIQYLEFKKLLANGAIPYKAVAE